TLKQAKVYRHNGGHMKFLRIAGSRRRNPASKSRIFAGYSGTGNSKKFHVTSVMPIYLCLLECCARLSQFTAMASLSHRQSWSLALLVAVFPCLLCARADNEAPTISYRTGTSEVRVTFFATDENNRLVQAIDRNDFAVVDGDLVIRDFRSLTRSQENTLVVFVLVDAR